MFGVVKDLNSLIKDDKTQTIIILCTLGVTILTGMYFYNQIKLTKLQIAEHEKATLGNTK